MVHNTIVDALCRFLKDCGMDSVQSVKECIALANDDRDIDLYHWSSPRFSAAWQNTLSVLVARGRAQVSVAAAMADWPKRIRDMRYADHEDRGMAD